MREFQITLTDYIGKATIPLEAKRLIISDLLTKLEKECNAQILLEIEQKNKEVNENAESV